MRVILSKNADDPIVGREYVDEKAHGEFVMVPGGAIIYRHRDLGEMFANISRTTFIECIRAWDRYLETVVTVDEEAEQLQVVEELRRDLTTATRSPRRWLLDEYPGAG
jgi:hypothetical protein